VKTPSSAQTKNIDEEVQKHAKKCSSYKKNWMYHNIIICIIQESIYMLKYTCIILYAILIHIHLLEVIFTGWRHKHYSVCNKTITDFCFSEYEFLLTCKTNIDRSRRSILCHSNSSIKIVTSILRLKNDLFHIGVSTSDILPSKW
jgi:hypothetical protein